jgi:hypothetical protein
MAQRFRFDIVGETQANGSIPVYTKWLYGPTLAGVRKCPCPDGIARTVFCQSGPDTFFSIPAALRIKGKYTKGFITHNENGYEFTANKF